MPVTSSIGIEASLLHARARGFSTVDSKTTTTASDSIVLGLATGNAAATFTATACATIATAVHVDSECGLRSRSCGSGSCDVVFSFAEVAAGAIHDSVLAQVLELKWRKPSKSL